MSIFWAFLGYFVGGFLPLLVFARLKDQGNSSRYLFPSRQQLIPLIQGMKRGIFLTEDTYLMISKLKDCLVKKCSGLLTLFKNKYCYLSCT